MALSQHASVPDLWNSLWPNWSTAQGSICQKIVHCNSKRALKCVEVTWTLFELRLQMQGVFSILGYHVVAVGLFIW